MDCKGGTGSKKSKNCFFGWESDGDCFFLDSYGVILIEYLQKGKTITGYYTSLVDKLKAKLEEKRPHLQKNKILFHQDNAPSYTSAVAVAKIHELRLELLVHSPYSPDLAPSDCFLFPHVKIAFGKQRFSSNEEAITFVNNFFAEKNAEYYLDGLQRWEHRWKKCK